MLKQREYCSNNSNDGKSAITNPFGLVSNPLLEGLGRLVAWEGSNQRARDKEKSISFEEQSCHSLWNDQPLQKIEATKSYFTGSFTEKRFRLEAGMCSFPIGTKSGIIQTKSEIIPWQGEEIWLTIFPNGRFPSGREALLLIGIFLQIW